MGSAEPMHLHCPTPLLHSAALHAAPRVIKNGKALPVPNSTSSSSSSSSTKSRASKATSSTAAAAAITAKGSEAAAAAAAAVADAAVGWQVFHYEGGIREFVLWMNEGKEAMHEPVYFTRCVHSGCTVLKPYNRAAGRAQVSSQELDALWMNEGKEGTQEAVYFTRCANLWRCWLESRAPGSRECTGLKFRIDCVLAERGQGGSPLIGVLYQVCFARSAV